MKYISTLMFYCSYSSEKAIIKILLLILFFFIFSFHFTLQKFHNVYLISGFFLGQIILIYHTLIIDILFFFQYWDLNLVLYRQLLAMELYPKSVFFLFWSLCTIVWTESKYIAYLYSKLSCFCLLTIPLNFILWMIYVHSCYIRIHLSQISHFYSMFVNQTNEWSVCSTIVILPLGMNSSYILHFNWLMLNIIKYIWGWYLSLYVFRRIR